MPKICANYSRIVLMEANGDCPLIEVPGLIELLEVCIQGDVDKLREMAANDPRQRVRSAARFIWRKHEVMSTHSEDGAANDPKPVEPPSPVVVSWAAPLMFATRAR